MHGAISLSLPYLNSSPLILLNVGISLSSSSSLSVLLLCTIPALWKTRLPLVISFVSYTPGYARPRTMLLFEQGRCQQASPTSSQARSNNLVSNNLCSNLSSSSNKSVTRLFDLDAVTRLLWLVPNELFELVLSSTSNKVDERTSSNKVVDDKLVRAWYLNRLEQCRYQTRTSLSHEQPCSRSRVTGCVGNNIQCAVRT